MGTLWDSINRANHELRKEFLCVPPYQCVNGVFVAELIKQIDAGSSPALKINGAVNLPAQRAYQMEYRYKKCKIFKPFLPVIEYATYDAMDGNWICAYLTFLPVVEAVLREWGKENPKLTFNKMKGFAPRFIEYLRDQKFYFDDRVNWSNSHIDYLQFILCDVLYKDFDAYKDEEFSEIFNRNLTLHRLEGVMDISEGLSNVTRIMLVLDIIAELYLMQTPKTYWECIFSVEPEKDLDYQLRWKFYLKHRICDIGPNDLLVIQNAFLREISAQDKEHAIKRINLEIDFLIRKI